MIRRVHAEWAADAVESLAKEGLADIRLHTDETTALNTALTNAQARRLSKPEITVPTPEKDIASQTSSFPPLQFHLLGLLSSSWLPLLAGTVLIASSVSLGARGWVACIVGLVGFGVLKATSAIAAPVYLYIALVRAQTRDQWVKSRRIQERLLAALKSAGFEHAIPAHELIVREANTLAASGRLSEAIDLYESAGRDALIPAWFHSTRKSSIFACAGRYDDVIECCRKACELAPRIASLHYDLALQLLLYRRDSEAAREAVLAAEGLPLAESSKWIISLVNGLIALEEGRYDLAKSELMDCDRQVRARRHVTFDGFESIIASSLCLANVGLQKQGDARAALRRAGRKGPKSSVQFKRATKAFATGRLSIVEEGTLSVSTEPREHAQQAVSDT